MPTGYTAIIGKKPDITFAEFALGCARYFGACISQRDDRNGPPVIEKPSDYHSKELEEAKGELSRLNRMLPWEVEAEFKKHVKEQRQYHKNKIEENSQLLASYSRMLGEIESFTPPTKDHQDLKSFMRQQIQESIKWDCDRNWHTNALNELSSLDVESWQNNRVASAKKQIQYHTEEYAKDVERTNKRNEWKRQLFKSLGVEVPQPV